MMYVQPENNKCKYFHLTFFCVCCAFSIMCDHLVRVFHSDEECVYSDGGCYDYIPACLDYTPDPSRIVGEQSAGYALSNL